jgi:hypothetical protein
MAIWWLLPAFVGLVGILMLVGGVARVFKAQLGGGLMRVLFGGLTLAGAMIIGLVGLNLQTYAQLSKEWPVGLVTIKKGTAEFDYIASIDLYDDGKPRNQPKDFQVTGEEIFVGGPIVTFKPWANVVGMDAVFRAETVRGGYFNANCTNTYNPRVETLDDVSDESLLDSIAESWKFAAAREVAHNSLSGQPLGDGAVYEIVATQDAFQLKPQEGNAVAQALQQQAIDRRSTLNCDPVTSPVQTPSGAVEYRAPGAPITPQAAPPAAAPAPVPNDPDLIQPQVMPQAPLEQRQ